MGKQKEKKFLEGSEWENFRGEFCNADDRSCALLGAAYICNCLEILILELFAHKDVAKKTLIRGMNPLATFSAKTKITFCANIIPKEIYDDINLIRKIRNKFAHELHGINFNTSPVKDWANELKFPTRYIGTTGEHTVESVLKNDPRLKFEFTCSVMSGVISDYYLERTKKIKNFIEQIDSDCS